MLDGVKFPIQVSDSLRIVQRDFLGLPQYYLYRYGKQLQLLDPEEVEELLKLKGDN